jgi:branched-chain amino acid transport system permease protein
MLGQLLVNGIAAGAIYSLVAVGFAIIYNTTKILHIAHAVVFTFAGYIYYVLTIGLGLRFWFGVPLAIALTAVFGLCIEVAVYRPIRRSGAGTSAILIGSLGTVSLVQGALAFIFSTDTKTLRQGALPTFDIGSASVTVLHLAILGVVIVVFPILQSFLKRSRVGTAIRALADNPLLTDAQGMDTNRLYSIIFLIGSGFAGIAGILVSLDVGVKPDMGFDVIFTSIVAVIVGGVGYLPGAFAGAFLLGLLQQLVVWKLESSWQSGIVFALLILFLIMRPQGFFGARMKSRHA